MKKVYFFFFCLMTWSMAAQDWRVVEIGRCPTTGSYDLVLADGRNDGVQRVYVTTKDGGVYEWSYVSGSWTTAVLHPGPLNNLMHMAAGDARNDGRQRIYFAEWDHSSRIFEATWNGAQWDIALVGAASDSNTGVVVGDGRNDGMNRLYLSGNYGLHEWSWAGNAWTNRSINSAHHEVSGDIGITRNDGVSRLLTNSNCTREISWSNGQHVQESIVCSNDTWPDAVQIADGRNDGVQRVYVNNTGAAGGRREYTWNGTSWEVTVIEAIRHRGDIHVARLQSDGRYRVYTTTSDYHNGPADDLFEYEWNGSRWMKTGTVVDAVSGATAMIASGIGRNDDTMRMYTPNYVTGGIYEITYSTPFVQQPTSVEHTSISNFSVIAQPNPWIDANLSVAVNASSSTTDITVDLWHISGQLMRRKVVRGNANSAPLSFSCSECLPGVYVIRAIDSGGRSVIQKLIKIQ